MKIEIRQPKYFSEIGKKDNQEDYLWPSPESASEKNRVFLMCDGIGGLYNGEVASKSVATAIGEYLTKNIETGSPVTKELFEKSLACGYDALDKADNGADKKMGTTMTCLVLHEKGALVAHMGDSRIYHIRPTLADTNGRTGIIYQSADHSLVNDLLRLGEITKDEAVNHPQRNVITRALQPNTERRHKADIFNIEDVQSGDYFFLCCDGVLEQVSNEILGSILSDATMDDEGKIKAIKQVCDGNTKDNYTCWLIPVEQVSGNVLDTEEEIIPVQVIAEPPHEECKAEPMPITKEPMTMDCRHPQEQCSNPTNSHPKQRAKVDGLRFVLVLFLLVLLGASLVLFPKMRFVHEDVPNTDSLEQKDDQSVLHPLLKNKDESSASEKTEPSEQANSEASDKNEDLVGQKSGNAKSNKINFSKKQKEKESAITNERE